MATNPHLEFEKDVVDLQEKIESMVAHAADKGVDVSGELRQLRAKLERLKEDTYRNLQPMEQVLVARHPRRPYTLDYINRVFEDFIELHGDRYFRDDEAIVGGWARFAGESVMVIGHQKGRDMKDNLKRNFGMPHPEGYRKALRLMRMAEKFGRPVITLIDTPGAYPGLGAEERGQAEAIARSLIGMAGLRTPLLSVVIGEGGSGGALALGVTDRILMLEHAIYSVISPEGCAAILWRDSAFKEEAANALKLTSDNLLELGICDEIVPEPSGGAHSDWDQAADLLGEALARNLVELQELETDELIRRRHAKYEAIGAWRGEEPGKGTIRLHPEPRPGTQRPEKKPSARPSQ